MERSQSSVKMMWLCNIFNYGGDERFRFRFFRESFRKKILTKVRIFCESFRENLIFFRTTVATSVAEPHHFYAAPAPAPAPGKNFDAAPAPAPTLMYSKAKF
jgi:hypothetical protein